MFSSDELPDDDEIETRLAELRAERAAEMEGIGDDLAEMAANLETTVIAELRQSGTCNEQAAILAEAAALIRKAARSFKAGSAAG